MIELHRVSKVFSVGPVKVPALTDVSLRIGKGEFAVLTGAAGVPGQGARQEAGAAPRRRADGEPRRRDAGRDHRRDQGHPGGRDDRGPRHPPGAARPDAAPPHDHARGRLPREGRGLGVLGFLIGEALRDLRRAGRVAVSAIVLITLSLAALGGFWLLSSNLKRALPNWPQRVRVIVYLKREPAPSEEGALLERVQRVPGLAAVAYISKADALKSLKQVLGKDPTVVAQL